MGKPSQERERFYYQRDDGAIVGYPAEVRVPMPCGRLVRRIWPVPTNPAELVEELNMHAAGNEGRSGDDPHCAYLRGLDAGYQAAADLVAEKLTVEAATDEQLEHWLLADRWRNPGWEKRRDGGE